MQNFKHRFPWDFVLSCQIFETSILVPKTLEEVEKKILRGSTIPDNILTWSTKVNSCSHFHEKTAFKICGIHRKIQGPGLNGRYEGRTSGSTTHANINRVWGCTEDHFLHINSRGIIDWHSSPFGCIQIELKLRVCVSIIEATIVKRCSNQMPSSLRFTTFSSKETLENTFRRQNLKIPGILPSREGSMVPMWGKKGRCRNCGQGIRVGRKKPNRLGRIWGRRNRGEGNSKNEKALVWGGKCWRETMSMALGFFFFFMVLLFWARVLGFENFGEHASEREVSLSKLVGKRKNFFTKGCIEKRKRQRMGRERGSWLREEREKEGRRARCMMRWREKVTQQEK